MQVGKGAGMCGTEEASKRQPDNWQLTNTASKGRPDNWQTDTQHQRDNLTTNKLTNTASKGQPDTWQTEKRMRTGKRTHAYSFIAR
eukprot:360917-Chlamydomonas_euryale.AAC.2